MFKWVKTQWDKINSPTLDGVQVEVTTHCNAACIYCPGLDNVCFRCPCSIFLAKAHGFG
jgi:MoaA/NifB/PqqE/SkfB family radical SAM enzyme